MKGLVSFHPIDTGFFDELVQPLVLGRKVNPESYLEAALRMRRNSWETLRFKEALARCLEQAEPPPPPDDGTVWEKVRARLERFDHRPEPLIRSVKHHIDPELHLEGRPFLITEGSTERVCEFADEYLGAGDDRAVAALAREQLLRLDAEIARGVEPVEIPASSPDMAYRSELLDALKALHDLGRAARAGESWNVEGSRAPAREVLGRELAWRAVFLHSRAVPFWVGRDVDGLATVCAAAEVGAPTFLVSPRRLFAEVSAEFPLVRESLQTELLGPFPVGAYVSPADVGELCAFLASEGAAIIRSATRHAEGPACERLLRKIRECASYAERHGTGYLEAGGIPPHGPELEDDAENRS